MCVGVIICAQGGGKRLRQRHAAQQQPEAAHKNWAACEGRKSRRGKVRLHMYGGEHAQSGGRVRPL
jgi:hypothetical protein